MFESFRAHILTFRSLHYDIFTLNFSEYFVLRIENLPLEKNYEKQDQEWGILEVAFNKLDYQKLKGINKN